MLVHEKHDFLNKMVKVVSQLHYFFSTKVSYFVCDFCRFFHNVM